MKKKILIALLASSVMFTGSLISNAMNENNQDNQDVPANQWIILDSENQINQAKAKQRENFSIAILNNNLENVQKILNNINILENKLELLKETNAIEKASYCENSEILTCVLDAYENNIQAIANDLLVNKLLENLVHDNKQEAIKELISRLGVGSELLKQVLINNIRSYYNPIRWCAIHGNLEIFRIFVSASGYNQESRKEFFKDEKLEMKYSLFRAIYESQTQIAIEFMNLLSPNDEMQDYYIKSDIELKNDPHANPHNLFIAAVNMGDEQVMQKVINACNGDEQLLRKAFMINPLKHTLISKITRPMQSNPIDEVLKLHPNLAIEIVTNIDQSGRTALMDVSNGYNSEWYKATKALQMVFNWIEIANQDIHAQLNQVDETGSNALELAVSNGDQNLIDLISNKYYNNGICKIEMLQNAIQIFEKPIQIAEDPKRWFFGIEEDEKNELLQNPEFIVRFDKLPEHLKIARENMFNKYLEINNNLFELFNLEQNYLVKTNQIIKRCESQMQKWNRWLLIVVGE